MHSKLIRASLVGAAALAAIGSIALATGRRPASSRDGAITACVRGNGQLRITGDAQGCRKEETVLRWSATGLKGDPGPPGPPRLPGRVGPTGRTGPTGPPGPAGVAGQPGAKGDRGAAGPTGPKGDLGLIGKAGPTGVAGPAGVAGPQGKTGPIGVAGVTGPRGATGPDGPEGPAGAQGPKGDPGAGLTSFGQLAGLPCSIEGAAGAIALSFDGAGHATLTCVIPSPPAGATVVRVNEIAIGTVAAAGDEFVELVNAGTGPADLGGWKLVYRSAAGSSDTTLGTIPAGTTIAAGAFYLLGSNAYTAAQPADLTFNSGLAAAGGAVGLRDATGGLIDSVGWGTAANALVETAPAPAPPATTPGSSIVRLPDGRDTGNNAADFVVTSSPTPRTGNH